MRSHLKVVSITKDLSVQNNMLSSIVISDMRGFTWRASIGYKILVRNFSIDFTKIFTWTRIGMARKCH